MVSYNDILSIDKIIDVYKNICLNTCHKEKLVRFELAFSSNIIQILMELKERKYKHGDYSLFLISEPKYRIVMSERMPDKIVNHLLSKYILIPCLTPKLIEMNVATRKDKGTKMGIFYLKKYINHLKINNKKVYALKCDISKYFYSIDHDILLEKLEYDIPDEDIINILKEIITSTDKDYINRQIDNMTNKEIEKLRAKNIPDFDIKVNDLKRLPKYKKGIGLPIGNETSQILAIYYLNGLDHFIKEKLRIKCYVRYMDDFVLLSEDREYLKYCLLQIRIYLEKMHLKMNKKTQIYDLDKGMNFFGYKFILKGKRLIILINNQTKKRVKRKLKKLKKRKASNYEQVKASYNGYFKMAKCGDFLYRAKF